MGIGEESVYGDGGGGKKNLLIALFAVLIIAVAAFIVGSNYGKTGFFGLSGISDSNQEAAGNNSLPEGPGPAVQEFNNVDLKAELLPEGAEIDTKDSGLSTGDSSKIETQGESTVLKSPASISGFEGKVSQSADGISAVGKIGGIESVCFASSFEKAQSAEILSDSIALENSMPEDIVLSVSGTLEISSPNGSSTVSLSKSSRVFLNGFEGKITLGKEKTLIDGSAESIRIVEIKDA